MIRPHWTLLVALLVPALAAQQGDAAGNASAPRVDAPALFATNCAKCHGLDGSGTGPTVLDRPARNFKEGGFSFGNTPETIARTIAYGIPGSPMPAFEAALSEDKRRALADYVITLGPPVKEVSEAEELMHVTDRPLVVRGILPPLVEGEHKIARGLLIGTPDGLTFEYAADDVRLLAVRLGDFVKRTDWGDRGGSPLEPLGKVVWSDGNTSGPWSDVPNAGHALVADWSAGAPLVARLLSTSSSPAAEIVYALGPPESEASPLATRALVAERPGSAMLGEHAGFSRHVRVNRIGAGVPDHANAVMLRFGGWTETLGPERLATDPSGGQRKVRAWTRPVGEDTGEVLRISIRLTGQRAPGIALQATSTGLSGCLDLVRSPQDAIDFDVENFVVSPWTPEIVAALGREVAP